MSIGSFLLSPFVWRPNWSSTKGLSKKVKDTAFHHHHQLPIASTNSPLRQSIFTHWIMPAERLRFYTTLDPQSGIDWVMFYVPRSYVRVTSMVLELLFYADEGTIFFMDWHVIRVSLIMEVWQKNQGKTTQSALLVVRPHGDGCSSYHYSLSNRSF